MITGFRRVTLSGADDDVDVRALVQLSEEFPFVEWGVLYSAKREGTPRYPSTVWRDQLRICFHTADWIKRKARGVPPISIHLCGEAARDTMLGEAHFLLKVLHDEPRVQINGWAPSSTPARYTHARLLELARCFPVDFILQLRDASELGLAGPTLSALGAAVLFDGSGGRGQAPAAWPAAPSGVHVGYAGGIKPSNVETVLEDIAQSRVNHPSPWWIDMESGVRDSNDRFDLGLVRQVLEICAKRIVS